MGHVPLVVLTADRPLELQGWGAPQTMPQQRLYGGFARAVRGRRASRRPPRPRCSHLRATAARAVATATRAPRGAVQLNVPFREPLAPVPDGLRRGAAAGARHAGAAGRAAHPHPPARSGHPYPRGAGGGARPPGVHRGGRHRRAARATRGDGSAEAVAALGRATGYPVLAEATSQARFGGGPRRRVRSTTRSCATSAFAARATAPELVLRFGGGLTPKGPQRGWTRSGAYIVQFSDDGALFDPQHTAPALVIEGIRCARASSSPEACRRGATRRGPRDFAAAERRGPRRAGGRRFAQDGRASPSRGIAREVVARAAGGRAALRVQQHAHPRRGRASRHGGGVPLRVLANRGANGIDGIVVQRAGRGGGVRAAHGAADRATSPSCTTWAACSPRAGTGCRSPWWW